MRLHGPGDMARPRRLGDAVLIMGGKQRLLAGHIKIPID
jgi:hypothetical protein